MKVAIIGAGFTGLSAAYYLSKNNHEIFLFEKEKSPGGLAMGFKENNWQWSLEKYYHHWFTNDKSVLDLVKEINYPFLIEKPKSSIFIENNIYQFDNPLKILTDLNCMSFFSRLEMGIVLAGLKVYPFWKNLENIRAESFLKKMLTQKAYEKIWEPQLNNKFGKYAKDVSLAWFWARIYKRTPKLAYPVGGFENFSNLLLDKIKNQKGQVFLGNTIQTIYENNDKKIVIKINDNKRLFDKVIFTASSNLLLNLAPTLPENYKKEISNLKWLGALILILSSREKFLRDNTYWLSVCEKNSPVTAIVEHTNFMDKKYYNNEHLIYLGNYLDPNEKEFNMKKEDLLEHYDSLLKRINPNYKNNINQSYLFKNPFAQPIIPLNYSQNIPSFNTPFKNLYLTNMQQIYPWDRGTNYAIEAGKKIADFIINNE